MKKITKIFAILTAALSLLAISCKGANQTKADPQGIQLNFISNSRTILPTAELNDLTDIKIIGIDEEENEYVFGEYSSITSISGFIPVQIGKWNIIVTAKKGITEFKAEAKDIQVVENNVTRVNLAFEFHKYGELVSGYGSINLILSYPGNDVYIVEATLLDKDFNDITEGSFTPVANKVQITFDNISTGAYYLCANFYGGTADSKTYINSFSDYVIVSDECESYAQYTIPALNELHTITYELNGGEILSSFAAHIPVSFNSLLDTALPASAYMKKDYYTFDGWYKTEDFVEGTEISTLTAGTYNEDITIYAKWSPITYTISYNPNGGVDSEDNSPAAVNYNVTSDSFDLPEITKKYYDFAGWYSTYDFQEETKVTEIDVTAPINCSLYAKWTEKQYPIEWILVDSNMDEEELVFTAPAQKYFTISNPIDITIPDALYPGYILTDWSISQEASSGNICEYTNQYSGYNFYEDAIQDGTESFRIVANWDKTPITVSFQTAYGEAPKEIKLHANTVAHAASQLCVPGSLLVPVVDEETGFASTKWYKSGDAEKTPVTAATTFEADTTLVANWKERYEVSYESDYGTVSESFIVEDGTLLTSTQLASITDSDYGFTSLYWYNAADELKAPVTTATAITSNITLKAKWKDRYTVTYDCGDSNVDNPQTLVVESGTYITEEMLPILGYSGFAIQGWYDSTDSTKTLLTPDTTAVTGNITLNATWVAGWKITYFTDYGTAPKVSYIGQGEPLTIAFLPTLETTGWVHKGWNYADDTRAQIGDIISEDIILTAYWYDECTVTYETPYGSAPVSFDCTVNANFTQEQLASITDPVTGFESQYWYFKNDPAKTPITTETVVPRDVTIVAAWKNRYTISYETAYETAPESKLVEDGYVLTKADLPRLTTSLTTDYFGGWYFGSEIVLKGNIVTSDMKLIALWDANVLFIVDFETNANVEIASLAVAPGTVLTAENFTDLTIPVGYEFTGWYDEEGNLFDGTSYTVNASVTFTGNVYFGKCGVVAVEAGSSKTVTVTVPTYGTCIFEIISDNSLISSYQGLSIVSGKKYSVNGSGTYSFTISNNTSELDVVNYRFYINSINDENSIYIVTDTTSVSSGSDARTFKDSGTEFFTRIFYLEAGKNYRLQWFDHYNSGPDCEINAWSLDSSNYWRDDDSSGFLLSPTVTGYYAVTTRHYNSYTGSVGCAFHIYCTN